MRTEGAFEHLRESDLLLPHLLPARAAAASHGESKLARDVGCGKENLELATRTLNIESRLANTYSMFVRALRLRLKLVRVPIEALWGWYRCS